MEPAFAIGLDLGGTNLKGGLVSASGELSAYTHSPSRVDESAQAPIDALRQAIEGLAASAPGRVIALGLGCPGAIDPEEGCLVGRTAHLRHWESFPLRTSVQSLFGGPVVVDNDANFAALAEHRLGAARDARVSLTITMGTGVGCGIVDRGRVVHGARGGAGEIGHLPLDGRIPCACGVPGCVEPECSGPGLVARAREAGLAIESPAQVYALAAAGEPRASALVARQADRLGATIAIAVQILNPDVVVIGGGVANSGELLLAPLREAVARYALPSHAGVRIERAALGEAAGTIGAGLAAWDRANAAD
ncbi:MAG TPA: ROK family protein [Terriglobales bacterium]|nr:ROK family protein [Terriglobales bacterium]